ncbi:MAG: response regulator [Planctomycetota bacterium]|jgi:CheY-like chemotaxis protein|nr:response regulator [Planctomycetota bacterium]
MKALLVEDNALIRKVAGSMLDKLGYETDFAEHGEIAVEKCRDRRYDVVLMDMHMPVMEGDEATRRIRRLPPPNGQVHIIAVTATDNADERAKIAESGMNSFLMKPFTLEALEEALSALTPKRGE